ncbi:hypothetical protein [Izhakiella capsodis]|nr:hypothetical protein [Izhakiella capsodis]
MNQIAGKFSQNINSYARAIKMIMPDLPTFTSTLYSIIQPLALAKEGG